jgi:predicted nucleic acid-binding protein
VLDSSAAVEYLLRSPRGRSYDRLIEADDADLHAPSLCDVEVAAALRRLVLAGTVAVVRATVALGRQLDLPLTRYDPGALQWRGFALRENFTSYDATYVVLAQALEAPLLTADDRLARAVRRHAAVELAG